MDLGSDSGSRPRRLWSEEEDIVLRREVAEIGKIKYHRTQSGD